MRPSIWLAAALCSLAAASNAEFSRLKASVLIAEQVPYLSLWCKTNVVVARAGLGEPALSPGAGFAFPRHIATPFE